MKPTVTSATIDTRPVTGSSGQITADAISTLGDDSQHLPHTQEAECFSSFRFIPAGGPVDITAPLPPLLDWAPDGTEVVRQPDGSLPVALLHDQLERESWLNLRLLWLYLGEGQEPLEEFAMVQLQAGHFPFKRHKAVLLWRFLILAVAGRDCPLSTIPVQDYAAGIQRFYREHRDKVSPAFNLMDAPVEIPERPEAYRAWGEHGLSSDAAGLQWVKILIGGLWQLDPTRYGGRPHGIDLGWMIKQMRRIRPSKRRVRYQAAD